MSWSVTSTHPLAISRDDESTTALASLYQCLTTLLEKRFPLISNLSLLWCKLGLFPFVLYMQTWKEKRQFLVSLVNETLFCKTSCDLDNQTSQIPSKTAAFYCTKFHTADQCRLQPQKSVLWQSLVISLPSTHCRTELFHSAIYHHLIFFTVLYSTRDWLFFPSV